MLDIGNQIVDQSNFWINYPAMTPKASGLAAPRQAKSDPVEEIRRFNRFYTRQLGLLCDVLHRSSFSLTEARILYELANCAALRATALARDLNLDAGYLSRTLRKFEARRLLKRVPSATDARQYDLSLTPAGRRQFAPLDRSAREQVAAMVEHLPADGVAELVRAMRRIERLLETARAPASLIVLRPLRIGDLGWIVHRQGILYSLEYGWDHTYEALVAEIAAQFVKNFKPALECCWIAEQDGQIMGSAFLVNASASVARLRLLYVEPAARGLGLGRRLVDECIRSARAMGYGVLTLWTNDVLTAARKIYQAAGFHLVEEAPHHSFGKDLVGQTWELRL
jgi:DNA-binding MarR family transcriptional regulator/N-acetylglutamate synthase-like GNAT family acetyltransferase